MSPQPGNLKDGESHQVAGTGRITKLDNLHCVTAEGAGRMCRYLRVSVHVKWHTLPMAEGPLGRKLISEKN